jgi:flavin-dependent dehydrogenase
MVALVRFGSLDSVDDRTFIEARPRGWWYAAGLPGNQVAVALFTDSDLLSPDHTELWDRLLGHTELMSRVLTAAHDLSPVHIVGASSGYLSQSAGSGWLAIGDAAQSYDPCSGQGITKALGSALAAAEAIEADDARAIHQYGASIAREFREFVDHRRAHYCRETRWPDEPFWRRRHVERITLRDPVPYLR